MDLATAKSIVELGLGPASFLALLFFGYQAFKGMKDFASKLTDNHLDHFQQALDTLVDNSTKANEKLDRIEEKLK